MPRTASVSLKNMATRGSGGKRQMVAQGTNPLTENEQCPGCGGTVVAAMLPPRKLRQEGCRVETSLGYIKQDS